MTPELISLSFPSSNFSEGQEKQLTNEEKLRRCTSFGEAASVITINESISYFFRLFYRGFLEGIFEWFKYSDISELENPISFRFQDVHYDNDELIILGHLVKPCLLPTKIRHGREKPPPLYEFHYPTIVARQMGFGQLPRLYSLLIN